MSNIFVGFMFALHAAAFNLYPTINPDGLEDSFGISIDCLDALNETIPCDQTLFQMSNTVDSYLWTIENVTNLCTPDCIASTAEWWSDVQTTCASETIAAYGKMVPAETITGRFIDGLGIACLQSDMSSDSSAPNNSVPCANTTSALTSSVPYSNASSATNTTSSGPSWCLIESQEWIGLDIIRPNCTTDSTDLSCEEDPLDVSPENERIANLYPHDMLCSDCFIRMFHQRMSSPYLPDSDYFDYSVAQYQDILDVCNTSNHSTTPYRNSTTPTTTAALRPSSSSSSSPAAPLPTQEHISTSCTGYSQAKHDDDCSTFAQANNIALTQLYALNGVLGKAGEFCSSKFWFGYYYCVASSDTLALGSFNSTTNTVIMSAIDSTPTATTTPIMVTTTVSTVTSMVMATVSATTPSTTLAPTIATIVNNAFYLPSPIQSGVASLCAKYAPSHPGDTCASFAAAHGIQLIDLYERNTALGPQGENCGTDFLIGYYYCVGGTD